MQVPRRLSVAELAQEIVAAVAQDEQLGLVVIEGRGQPRQAVCTHFSRHAGAPDLARYEFLQHCRVTGIGLRAGAEREAVAERQNHGVSGQFG